MRSLGLYMANSNRLKTRALRLGSTDKKHKVPAILPRQVLVRLEMAAPSNSSVWNSSRFSRLYESRDTQPPPIPLSDPAKRHRCARPTNGHCCCTAGSINLVAEELLQVHERDGGEQWQAWWVPKVVLSAAAAGRGLIGDAVGRRRFSTGLSGGRWWPLRTQGNSRDLAQILRIKPSKAGTPCRSHHWIIVWMSSMMDAPSNSTKGNDWKCGASQTRLGTRPLTA